MLLCYMTTYVIEKSSKWIKLWVHTRKKYFVVISLTSEEDKAARKKWNSKKWDGEESNTCTKKNKIAINT